MVTITASTTHSMKATGKAPSGSKMTTGKGASNNNSNNNAAGRASVAPPLKPITLNHPTSIEALLKKSPPERKGYVTELFEKVIGMESVVRSLSTPHAASTTRDRSGAAADLAVATRELGVSFVLKECQVQDHMQRILFPAGIEKHFTTSTAGDSNPDGGGMVSLKPSASALSLSSLVPEEVLVGTTTGTVNSTGTDSKRGKSTPPAAREGCLLLLRALCQIVGRKVEPFVVGAFLAAAIDECGSSSSEVRQAAEDTSVAIVTLAHAWTFPSILFPILVQPLDSSTEWRVKAAALERLQQCASQRSPVQTQKLIPKLIPIIANQVWDTKAQVQKAARACLQAICDTNTNPDIQPAIPAIVNAICKPADTNKAVSELMGTTFVVPVDASTLAILCPVLARALKEKLAIHKRAACLVITNMSKLVIAPEAIAPFGYLLVPELTKVAHNVQFEEIRDEALKALEALTKALGDSYTAAAIDTDTDAKHEKDALESQHALVEAEQKRIEQDRLEAQRKEEENRLKEEEEKKKFKEAMDAQRQLDLMAAQEAQKKRDEEEKKREAQKLSTKSTTGTCQMCGLKKCKKSCMFYPGK